MGDLSVFVPEEKDFLSGVFYKIGVWISHIDDDGDCAADAEEEKVLMDVLDHLSKKHKDTPLVSQMASEASRQVESHDRWVNESDEAIEHSVKAGKMIKSQMSAEDLSAYKSALGEVAKTVATAFREGEGDDQDKGAKIRKFLVKITNKSLYEERNISPEEDSALNELYSALQDI